MGGPNRRLFPAAISLHQTAENEGQHENLFLPDIAFISTSAASNHRISNVNHCIVRFGGSTTVHRAGRFFIIDLE